MYKNYKQRLEELERKHNIRINVRFILFSNLITALLVGFLVYNVQYRILKKRFGLNEQKFHNVVEQTFTDNKLSVVKDSYDISKDLVNIGPVLVGKLIKWLYVWQKVMPGMDFGSFNKFEQKNFNYRYFSKV